MVASFEKRLEEEMSRRVNQRDDTLGVLGLLRGYDKEITD